MRSFAVLMMLAFPASMAAQSTFKLKPPVDQLEWMIGEWEGPASYQRGPQPQAIRQTERVEIQSGGTAIAVRGRGFFTNPDGSEEVRYEAFAVLFKNRDGTLGFRAFNMEGQYIDPTITLTGNVLLWTFEDPRIGKVRYTTTHTPADEWHEIGEWSRDGTTWTRFMEMTLTGNVLVWTFEDPRIGKVRYTTTHTPADEWHEIGEWSRDGTTWTRFMEMTLKRK